MKHALVLITFFFVTLFTGKGWISSATHAQIAEAVSH